MEFAIAAIILQNAVVAGVTVLLAEVVRDGYHVASHINPFLWRWHRLHHQLFGWNYRLTSPEAYRYAQWCYDVPEAMVMLGFTLLILVASYFWLPFYQAGLNRH